jgi:hypothetical protein
MMDESLRVRLIVTNANFDLMVGQHGPPPAAANSKNRPLIFVRMLAAVNPNSFLPVWRRPTLQLALNRLY